MTDAEYLFKSQSAELKRTGRGAYNRKGGSRSKRCSLPSDNLTEAQKRRMNGEVMSCKLNEPMSWKEFRKLPTDVQALYIIHLRDEYGARNTDIAKMMGVERSHLSRHISANLPKLKKSPGGVSKYEDPRWTEFVKKNEIGVIETITVEVPGESIEPIEPEAPDEKPMPEKRTIPLRVLSGKLNFSGNAGAIFTKANLLFDSAKEYDIKIIFKEVCDA